MNFTFENQDNIVIFTIKNSNLDSEISPQLKAKILILCQPDVEAFIIDMSNVDYVDSSGLGALLLANRQLREYGQDLILTGVRETVMKMFNISQLTDLFTFYDTLEEALQFVTNVAEEE